MQLSNIPTPTVERLCRIIALCDEFDQNNIRTVSSALIASRLGVTADLIRRDISSVGEIGSTGSGYTVLRLKQHLSAVLGLNRIRRACLVGLGRLGKSLLEYDRISKGGFELVAGFDASVNRLETIRTSVRLYPAYEMGDVVKREKIEAALLAVPASVVQACADILIDSGVKCIVNFAPVVVKTQHEDVSIRDVDITNELRVVSVMAYLKTKDSFRSKIEVAKKNHTKGA